ncbi:MAG: SCO family protein [Acidobacteria bacterium]|nr:SCO family protein [Acidobacteriota bacterium]
MKNISRRNVMALLGAAPFVAAVAARAESPKPAPRAEDVTSRDRIREKHFPNVQLVTHEGKKVRFYDDLVKDKVVVINFMYAKCEGICPGITTNLVKVQRILGGRVGKDIFMYSLSLKPEQDTPEALAEYARMHKVGPGWQYLTGAPADLELLRRSLGFTDPDPLVDADKSNHIGNVRYGNEPLQRWAACPGMSKPEMIVESIGWLLPQGSRPSAKGEGK